jgi:hypothetical protein
MKQEEMEAVELLLQHQEKLLNLIEEDWKLCKILRVKRKKSVYRIIFFYLLLLSYIYNTKFVSGSTFVKQIGTMRNEKKCVLCFFQIF